MSPGGLKRNESAWLLNFSCRDGGLNQRGGWIRIGSIANASGFFQGKTIYNPVNADPYLIYLISGHVIKVDPDTAAVTDLSAIFGLTMPATEPFAHFSQAEEFLIIQSGDNVTLPLFWDGTTLRRSIGITNTAVAPGTPGVNEIPAGTSMSYYMGRLWYSQGRTFSAGDIVYGPSGTTAYRFRDSVLNVTENPLVVGGDGFAVAAEDGIIRALKVSGAIDAALGQGRLFIFTRKAVYSLTVPVTRTDWIGADSNNGPLLTIVQLINGSVNDRSVVAVNGDLYYQSLEPSIRSLDQSVRYFNQPGNRNLSANLIRILQFNDRALLRAASGIYFDSRMIQTALPRQTDQGIVHDQLVTMDFIPVSTFGQDHPPNWEGSYLGMPIFQMVTGDFGGKERAFATVLAGDGSIELWEITREGKFDYAENRIVSQVETPAWTWGDTIGERELKKLVSAEIWADRLTGTVNFSAEYRPDGAICWLPWIEWKECSPKDTAEASLVPPGYTTPLGPCYKATMVLPKPPESCAPCGTGRPAYIAFQHQFRLTIKGNCRIRGIWLVAEPVERPTYPVNNMVCAE
jgi:hypothetical protein